MENKLLQSYRQIFADKQNEPGWAVHKTTPGHAHELVHCSIPFVGKHYAQEKTKILLYASAENLSKYKGHLDCDDYAINRHRHFFDSSTSNSSEFYPDVHIQPISDGCLAIVALYLYMKFQYVSSILPSEFLEKISFANYCKYTIQPDHSGRNKDPAHSTDYLKHSREYIESDIEVLKPDYIIIPKTIYWTELDFIERIRGEAKIVPIYQINARNINLRIKNCPRIEKSELDTVLLDWCNHLGNHGITGKTKENFFSIFSYLDRVIENDMR